MDFGFSQSQKDVAELARRVFAEDVEAARRWRRLAEVGLLGVALPEEHGGSGGGLLELCTLLEEQGRATAEAPLLPALVTAMSLADHGAGAWLPALAAGEVLLTAGFSQTETCTLGTDRRVTGVVSMVQAADRARRVLLAVDEGLVLVDPRAPGAALEAQTLTTGETAYRLTLRSVECEPAGDGLARERMLARATVGVCALHLGVAERALAMTAAYTSQRRQFERPIASFQAVGQRAADAYIDVEAMRVTLWRAAWLLAEGRDATAAVAIAKLWACEAGHRVVQAAQHLHGGIGFDVSYPLGRSYLWSKQLELTLGSAGSHLARLGAQVRQR
jgi:alkylation response protein AidB-like acyl-CoA dehydrogenase